MLVKLAWRNIFRNKRRSLISLSSITFALFFAIFMRSLQFGAYDHMIKNIVNSFMGSVQVHHKNYLNEFTLDNSIELDDLKGLNNLKHADFISPRIETYALCGSNELSKPVMVMGMDMESERKQIKLDRKVIEGDYPLTGSDGVLLSVDLAAFFNIHPGDSITVFGQGYHGSIAAGYFRIAGIVDLHTPDLNKRTLIIPFDAAAELYNMQGMATTVVMGTNDDWRKLYKEALHSVDTLNYAVVNWQQKLPELVQLIKLDSAGGLVVLSVLYLIIAFGLFGLIIMLTEERKFESGVLLAIGMRKSKLLSLFIIETLLISLGGLLTGFVLSLPFVIYFNIFPIKLAGDLQEVVERFGFEAVIPTSLDPSIAVQQALVIIGIVLLVNTYSLYKIKKLKPVEAMKQ